MNAINGFRVWIELEKRYEPTGDNWFSINSNGDVLGGVNQTGRNIFHTTNKIKIEPCLGITDKDGDKIYAGDILRITLSNKNYFIGQVSFDDFNQSWIVSQGSCFMMGFGEFNSTVSSKIIGNINENPELTDAS